jgi:hypothetical protein
MLTPADQSYGATDVPITSTAGYWAMPDLALIARRQRINARVNTFFREELLRGEIAPARVERSLTEVLAEELFIAAMFKVQMQGPSDEAFILVIKATIRNDVGRKEIICRIQ